LKKFEQKHYQRQLLLTALILFSSLVNLHAGVTGKISGQITDSQTSEPLIGVNVIIDGTSLGAATDIEGRFAIIQIPPGTYELTATTIGYTRYHVTDVRVLIDQNNRMDFTLTSTAIEGESVTVVATRPVVRPDVATSVTALRGNEVRELPVATVSAAIALQAGIEDGLVIRGGGAEELLFQIDDITLRDARNNQPITSIPISSIQELSIERGGFNAEYGQVRTGVVNIVTREGGKSDYEGTITAKYGPAAPKHFGISPFDKNSMWMRPYMDDDVAWTGTDNGAWNIYTQDQYPDFNGWNAVSEQLLSDSDPSNDLSPLAAQKLFMWQHRRTPPTDQIDYNLDFGLGGPVPGISEQLGDLRFYLSGRTQREMLLIPLSRDDYLDHDFMISLSSDLRPGMKLRYIGLKGRSSNVAQNYDEAGGSSTAYIRSPYQIALATGVSQISSRIFTPSYYSMAVLNHSMNALQMNHTLSAKTFYEISIERVSRSYLTGPIDERDTTQNVMIAPGYYVDEAPFGFSGLPETGIGNEATDFFFGGHMATTRDSSSTTSNTIKFDLTSQVNFENLIKTGFELVIEDLNISHGLVKDLFPDANVYSRFRDRPIRGGAYVQDKYEVKEFVLNLGIRADYSNPRKEWPDLVLFSDEWNEYASPAYHADSSYSTKKAEAILAFSPRLAISHPITENSKLFFNYGHFQQSPTNEQRFKEGRGALGELDDFGNPDLVLEKTISYELGFDYSIFNEYLIQVSAFYHDIFDQQDYTQYSSREFSFRQVNNNSYEDIRGFELSARKNEGRWLTGFFNYTYQVNSSGRFGKAEIHENPTDQRYYDENTANLYQSKPIPQPYGRASLTFHTPKEFGPKLAGIRPVGGWAMNFLGYWRAGRQARVTGTYPGANEGSGTYLKFRDYYNLVLRVKKNTHIQDKNFSFFVEVSNLLNTKRLSLAGFQDFHDQLSYFTSLHLPKSRDYTNIVGDDMIGDFRKDDVDFQPIEQQGLIIGSIDQGVAGAIYYGKMDDGDMVHDSGYWEYIDGDDPVWSRVSDSRMDKILDERAYIDMPNQTSFNFLNPRQIFIGVQITF
jgi:outer membrane receptor protein involved in Fe transport